MLELLDFSVAFSLSQKELQPLSALTAICRKGSGGKWMNFRAYLDSFCIHVLDFAWKFALSEQTCVSKKLMSLNKM